jgi:hypothetical protein
MSTTVTITIVEQKLGLLGTTMPKTEITITRPSKAAAIAEALTMAAAAHRGEFERAWAVIRDQVEPLIAAYRMEVEAQRAAAAEQPAQADEPA